MPFPPVPKRVADAGDDGEISVFLDQARLVKLPERVATLVIGNPLIADVSLQSGSLMVVTGKGYGVTNVVALDRNGVTLMERPVQVKGTEASTLVVYRGMQRETYSCAPICEPRVTLGDSRFSSAPRCRRPGPGSGRSMARPSSAPTIQAGATATGIATDGCSSAIAEPFALLVTERLTAAPAECGIHSTIQQEPFANARSCGALWVAALGCMT